jgi:dolichol-phosphate mannosyltransferase
MPKGLVIFPTYNEAENIERIITAVLAQSPELDVLVVDDNSPDKTWEIVERLVAQDPRIHLLRRERKLGLGTAYITGFKYSLEHGYDYCFEMDADFSHPPDAIPRFIELMHDYDLIIGSRYSDGVSVVNWPMKRLLLSYFANVYARIVTGCPIRDLTAGFKCYKRKVLEGINLDRLKEDGYGFQIEIDYTIWRKGFRVKETPIIFVERRAGVSKMNKRIIRRAFVLVLRLRWQRLLGRI